MAHQRRCRCGNQGKEYFIDYQYTLQTNEQVGSFATGKSVNFELSETQICTPLC